jgi:FtsH-binding integral membrane protein
MAGVVVGFIVDRFSWSSVIMTLTITAGLTALFSAVFAWWLKRVKEMRHELAPQAI